MPYLQALPLENYLGNSNGTVIRTLSAHYTVVIECYYQNFFQVDPNRPVFVHGDLERLNMEKANANGGLTYVQDQHETNAKLAAELNVRPMTSR